jgi:Neuraminidase (sialidase)
VSLDRGRTWTPSFAHFSVCSGGTYDRASDPWVAISPDGTVNQAALGIAGAAFETAILVSHSVDGGFTWSEPLTLDRDPSGGDDKESISADPADSRYVYLVWDRLTSHTGPAWFSRTTDGGATWEQPRVIYDPGSSGFATGSEIVVLPDGTLVNVFVLSQSASSAHPGGVWVAAIRSTDHGLTWSTPILIATDQTIGTVDSKLQTELRTGSGIPNASVDRASGAIYVVWADARFSGGARDAVALSRSTDGGLTWSAPAQVNQAPNVQAFTPAVAAGAAGTVAVTYFDFRNDSNDPSTLLASYWKVTSQDGGSTWHESPVAGPFDILSAPQANGQPFLGDYQGLAASGDLFVSFFVSANSGNTANRTSVTASSLKREGNTRTTLRTEVNLRPRAYNPFDKPAPKKK